KICNSLMLKGFPCHDTNTNGCCQSIGRWACLLVVLFQMLLLPTHTSTLDCRRVEGSKWMSLRLISWVSVYASSRNHLLITCNPSIILYHKYPIILGCFFIIKGGRTVQKISMCFVL